MTSPPAKFCKLPDSAIPTATPAEAKRAAKEVVSTPKALTTMIIRRIVSEILTILFVKVLTLTSMSRLSSIFLTKRSSARMMKRPMINTIIPFKI